MQNAKPRWVMLSGIFVIVILSIIAVLDTGYDTSPFSNQYENICAQWRSFEENGETGYSYDLSTNEYVTPSICVYNYYSEYDVVADDKVIYAYRDKNKTLGNAYQIIELPVVIEESTIRLVNRGEKKYLDYSIEKNVSYYGEKGEIYNLLLRKNVYGLVIFLISLFCSGMAFAWKRSIDDDVTLMERKAVLYYALLFIVFGVCFIANSQFVQVIWGLNFMTNVIRFIAVFLIPVLWLGILITIKVLDEKFIFLLLQLYMVLEVACFGIHFLGMIQIEVVSLIYFLFQIFMIVICSVKIKQVTRFYENGQLLAMIAAEIEYVLGITMGSIFLAIGSRKGYFISNLVAFILFMYLCGKVVISITSNSLKISSVLRTSEMSKSVDPLTYTKNKYAFLNRYENVPPFRGLAFVCVEISCDENCLDEQIVILAECMDKIYGKIGKNYRTSRNQFMAALEGIPEKQIKQSIERIRSEYSYEDDGDEVLVYAGYVIYEKGANSFESCSEMWTEAEKRIKLLE